MDTISGLITRINQQELIAAAAGEMIVLAMNGKFSIERLKPAYRNMFGIAC